MHSNQQDQTTTVDRETAETAPLPDTQQTSSASAPESVNRKGLSWPTFDIAWFQRNSVYLALAVLLIVNALITPNFVTADNLRLQLIQVAPVVIVALGMAVVIGTQGIDLSVGVVMALAAAVIPLYIGYGTIPAILIGLMVGVVSGWIAGGLVARVGLQPIVATLGIMVAGRGLAIVIGGQIKTINDPGLVALGSGQIFGIPYIVLIAAVVTAVIAQTVRRTTFGRQLVAIGGNRRAAGLAGLPVRRVLTSAYMVSGVLAALAGILLSARSQASDPTSLGLLMELSAITAVVIGGTPLSGGKIRIWGTVFGALLVQVITSTLIAHNVADSIAQMSQAVLVVIAVYLQVGRRSAK